MTDPIILLKQLIGCRSITPEQAGALDLAQQLLIQAGFIVQRLPVDNVDNLWATDTAPPSLLLAGHVDVVPPGEAAMWHSDPFIAEECEGFIYGRGAADMKAGVAAMLCTAIRLRQQGFSGIAVLLTSDEEGPAVHGTRHVVEWWRQHNKGFIEFAIIGEPTSNCVFGDTIKIGRRGSLTATITVHGQQAHVAYPHRGDNPNHRLINVLAAMRLHWPLNTTMTTSLVPPTSFQVVSLQSGAGANNMTPATAIAVINFRYAAEDQPAQLQQAVESFLTRAAEDNWFCVWEHGAVPFFTATDSVLVRTLQGVIADVTGEQAVLSTSGGTSDGRFLCDICEQLAEFGPRSNTIHAPNERVEVNEVRQLALIYEQTAQRLLSTKQVSQKSPVLPSSEQY